MQCQRKFHPQFHPTGSYIPECVSPGGKGTPGSHWLQAAVLGYGWETDSGRRRRIERMVTPQVWVNPGDWLPSEGPSLSSRKNSRASQLKWKWVYWKADTLSKSRVQAFLKGENAPRVWGWLVFMGSVISYSSEWEEYFIIWGKGGIFRNWGRTHYCPLWSSLELSWHWHEDEWLLVL